MDKLGDTHNFGKLVHRSGNWIVKPRPVKWEWLFLCKESPIRKLFKEDCINSPFFFFPYLEFRSEKDLNSFSNHHQEYFDLNYSEKNISHVVLSQAIGRLIAVSHFWGLADLHIENIFMGHEDNKFFLFPIDIETALDPFHVMSQSYLLKSISNSNEFVGLGEIPSEKIKTSVVIYEYIETMHILEMRRQDFEEILAQIDIEKTPVRRILRNTSIYSDFLNSDRKVDIAFFKSEFIQLNRGDIPYFYSYPSDTKIYFRSASGEMDSEISWDDIYPIPSEKILGNPKFLPQIQEKLVKQTCLQIARNFIPAQGKIDKWKNIEVEIRNGKLFIIRGNTWRLRCESPSF